jgi:phosphatidate cytidylyltransferase
MNAASSDLWTLVLGILAILVVASVIGYVLQQRLSPDGSNASIENLNARIKAWWVMAILIGIAFLAGRIGVLVLFGFCSFAALREFITLTHTKRADHWALASSCRSSISFFGPSNMASSRSSFRSTRFC